MDMIGGQYAMLSQPGHGAVGEWRRNVPERSIQAASELGTVRHERDFVAHSCVDKSLLDSTNATVHHVAGSNAVRSSLGVVDGDLRKTLHRRLVVDGAILMEDTAVAVGGIFAQTDVGSNVERRECISQYFDGLDHGSVGVIGESALLVL